MDFPPTSAEQTLPEGATSIVMVNPLWLLLPWALVALSAGVKFWRLTSAWRQRPGIASSDQTETDTARQTLERIWAQDQQRR